MARKREPAHAAGMRIPICSNCQAEPGEVPAHYQLLIREDDWGHRHMNMIPTASGPCLMRVKWRRFTRASHRYAHRLLGAHLAYHRTESKGIIFAVWAPNAALRVSVVGDFNGWDGRCHPMRLQHESHGIWEIFIPGLDSDGSYKYEIRNAHTGDMHPEGRSLCPRLRTCARIRPAWCRQPVAHRWAMANGCKIGQLATGGPGPCQCTKFTWVPGAGSRTAVSWITGNWPRNCVLTSRAGFYPYRVAADHGAPAG